MPSIAELARGKELSIKGADHLNYILKMPKKEYELRYLEGRTKQETQENEDKALHDAMLADLEQHKLTCPGCSSKTLGWTKRQAARLAR